MTNKCTHGLLDIKKSCKELARIGHNHTDHFPCRANCPMYKVEETLLILKQYPAERYKRTVSCIQKDGLCFDCEKYLYNGTVR